MDALEAARATDRTSPSFARGSEQLPRLGLQPAIQQELSPLFCIEPARLDDAEAISRLVGYWADRGEMLHRPVTEVYEAIRDFKVARMEGEVIGCASLHIMGRDLAEVRSLAVKEDAQARGIGAALVRSCVDEATAFGIERVFALTYKPGFFEKLSFRVANVMEFPQKVWGECVRCPFFANCKEVAVLLDLREGADVGVPLVRD